MRERQPKSRAGRSVSTGTQSAQDTENCGSNAEDSIGASAFDRARIGVLNLDADARISYVNAYCCDMLTSTPGDLITRHIKSFLCPGSRDDFEHHLKSLDAEGIGPVDMQFLSSEERAIDTQVWMTPLGHSATLIHLVDTSSQKREIRLLSLARDLSQKLTSVSDIKQAFEICIDTALDLTCADSIGIHLIDEQGDFNLAAHRGFKEAFVNQVSRFSAASPQADLIKTGTATYGPFGNAPAEVIESFDRECIHAVGIIPVHSEGRVVAAFSIASHQYDVFPDSDRDILETIGHQVAKPLVRLRMENKLRKLEDQYRLVVENALEAIFVVQDKRFLFSNSMFHRISGYTSAELSALTFESLIYTEDRHLTQAFAPGSSQISEQDATFQFRLIPKSGDPIWCEIKPTTIIWDRKPAHLCFLTDITHRRDVEKELRVQKAYLEELFEGAPEAIVILDNNDRILRINREFTRLFGFSPEESLGHRVNELIVPSERRVEGLAATQHVADGRTVQLETVRVHKDGNEINVSILGKPVLLGKDQLAVYGIYRDVTAIKKAEQARRKLEEHVRRVQKLESLGVLAGGIAHDFNNLLVGILGNANHVLSQLPSDSPIRDSMSAIEKSALRAAELTNQMLAYSGKGQFVIQAINLSDLVRDMTEFLKVSISKKVRLSLELDADIPAIEADAAQIRQVVMSLISNASEAIGENTGKIRLSTGVMACDRAFLDETYLRQNLPEGNYVYFEVEDSGCGMDEDTKKTIFDPFFTTKFTGRGLGLAAALGIVRGHHGAIHISSTEGRGSVFRVLFPQSEKETYVPQEVTPPPKTERKATKTVLFVDDEELVRETALRMLEGLDYGVLTACDGKEAVRLYHERRNEIDLVILDMKMPRMDGDEAFRKIREIDPEAKVVLSSGYTEQVVRRQFTCDVPAGFIQKPYRLMDLQKKIEATLGPA